MQASEDYFIRPDIATQRPPGGRRFAPGRVIALTSLALGVAAGAVAIFDTVRDDSQITLQFAEEPEEIAGERAVAMAPGTATPTAETARTFAPAGAAIEIVDEIEPPTDRAIAGAVEVAVASGAITPQLNPQRAVSVAADQAASADTSDGLTPRLNPRLRPQEDLPRLASLRFAVDAAVAPVASAAEILVNTDPDETPPFYFEADLDPRQRSRIAPEFDDIAPAPSVVTVSLQRGENFVDALSRAGVAREDRNLAAAALGEHHNLRRLRPGHEFVLTLAEPRQTLFELAADHDAGPKAGEKRLIGLEFRPDAENVVRIDRQGADQFASNADAVSLTPKLVSIAGQIDGSLFASAIRLGAPHKAVADLANVFAYDVDFQREIFGGDEFEAIFEVLYNDRGEMVGAGDILYARLNWRGRQKDKGYYRFASAGGAEYFDATGQSARRLLMKTPIDGARLSSGFGTRRHPILGYARAHKGVDFAAPRGTPIYAAGDGVVERANRYGSFGNYVSIRHANGYKTAYAHLNGFARGMRAGKRVRQGDVIGYVGTTGRSTGPHLHYEVHLNGAAVNPQRLKIATGVSLKGEELERFKAARDVIEAMRTPPPADPEPPMLAADENHPAGAL